MKTFFLLLLTVFSILNVSAQDTLRKVVEYDIKMESMDKIESQWFKDYTKSPGGGKHWISKLLLDLSLGNIKGYEEFGSYRELEAKWFQKAINGALADTVYVIDPITFEEKFEILQHDPWNLNKMTALRIKQEWKWDEQLQERVINTRMAVLYEVFDHKGKYRGLMPLFWIDLT